MITPADLANLQAIKFERPKLDAKQASQREDALAPYIPWVRKQTGKFASIDLARFAHIKTNLALSVLERLRDRGMVRRCGFRKHYRGTPAVLWEVVA